MWDIAGVYGRCLIGDTLKPLGKGDSYYTILIVSLAFVTVWQLGIVNRLHLFLFRKVIVNNHSVIIYNWRNTWNNQDTSWRDVAGRRFSSPYIIIIVDTVFDNVYCHTGRKEYHLSWRVCKSWRMMIYISNISIKCYHARWWYERKKEWWLLCLLLLFNIRTLKYILNNMDEGIYYYNTKNLFITISFC